MVLFCVLCALLRLFRFLPPSANIRVHLRLAFAFVRLDLRAFLRSLRSFAAICHLGFVICHARSALFAERGYWVNSNGAQCW